MVGANCTYAHGSLNQLIYICKLRRFDKHVLTHSIELV